MTTIATSPQRHLASKKRQRCTPGVYVVTLYSYQQQVCFGRNDFGEITLNDWGQMAQEDWIRMSYNHPYLTIDEFVVTPTFLHGIVLIHNNPKSDHPEAQKPNTQRSPPISFDAIIWEYKRRLIARLQRIYHIDPSQVWGSEYHKRMIYTPTSLDKVRAYLHSFTIHNHSDCARYHQEWNSPL